MDRRRAATYPTESWAYPAGDVRRNACKTNDGLGSRIARRLQITTVQSRPSWTRGAARLDDLESRRLNAGINDLSIPAACPFMHADHTRSGICAALDAKNH